MKIHRAVTRVQVIASWFGVKGGEEDWSDLSSGESSTVHNEYKGAISGVDGTATSPVTIL
ncbi:MAG: hypothetical protein KIIPBIDF_00917 [Candidatus Methanoperedenaceae archaeon GB50]|nr:MAG: hypothetical protein KIIPBIDF_00917 [Candidatus Methanoperedenaceae archaeon GB50]